MEEIKENVLTPDFSGVSDELADRKKKLLGFLKKKGQWIYYAILAFIIFIATFVRTRNISKLKDITTGTWTLGPDLDPFLFLRWAKYIAQHGSLFILDKLRSVPLADICVGIQCNPVNTSGDMKLLSYMIVWVWKFLSIFKEASVTYAAIIFPVIMFVLTIIAFFLFARKVFYKMDVKSRNIIALISTAFFAVVPSLLPRTIAGIPEKESAAFFFIFLSFYFFLEAFTSEKLRGKLIFGILSGITTGLLALIWGGAGFVFLTIPAAVLFAFLLGKIDTHKFYSYGLWVLSFTLIMIPSSTRYALENLLTSTSTAVTYLLFLVLGVDILIFKKKIFKLNEKIKIKLPQQIISLIISFVLIAILGSLAFGISFIPHQVQDVISQTIHPLDQTRFSVTVAENKQPSFVGDWKDSFGPVIWNIPLFFWLFFIGSIFLFANLIEKLEKKERIILTIAYTIFLAGLIFSKYSPSGVLNGESTTSLIVYFGGVLVFLISFGYFYIKRYKESKLSAFKEFEFSYLIYFIVLTMAIMAARGAVRLIMVLGAISPLAIGFLVYKTSKDYFKQKDNVKKFAIAVIALIIIIAAVFTLWTYYRADRATGENFAPGPYQWQWQKAMAWVRENTSVNAVFAHWWDYGYWVQSIGERATIVDGGNSVGYWNHLMGRYVLAGNNEKDSLDFLYAHNATHLLIDSSEIGKYTAFSSIGSDGDYDKMSWIPEILMDEKQIVEKNNETMYVYIIPGGGTATDEDILWSENGKDILLPGRSSYLIGVILSKSSDNRISQPTGVFVYNNQQYRIPFRYVYIKGNLNDFNSGLDAGIFLYPRIETTSTGIKQNGIGAGFYLSPRTIHSSIAQLYLFEQKSDYFKIAHVESNAIVSDLKSNGFYEGEFLYYQGFQGPIKIWAITYPSDIKLKQEYLNINYPKEFQTTDPARY
ncbi:MAG: STT3 domain-containing protein [Nanoarchaeota archaeon]|nr:STT3 domain-containing protein [Nanoarchaeota archaeon]